MSETVTHTLTYCSLNHRTTVIRTSVQTETAVILFRRDLGPAAPRGFSITPAERPQPVNNSFCLQNKTISRLSWLHSAGCARGRALGIVYIFRIKAKQENK